MSSEFLKTAVVLLLAIISIIISVISFASPELIQVNIEYPHTTTETTTIGMPITDPQTIFILAATFLTAAIFLAILLMIVALKMSS